MRYVLLALLAGVLAGCQPEKTGEVPVAPAVEPNATPVVDMHTSRIALDWSGVYEGLLPCADCAGIHMRLTLGADESFEIVTRRLARDEAPSSGSGQFEWEPSGNIIVLDPAGSGQRFAVGEGRLLLLETGQEQPRWDQPDAVLAQVSTDWRGNRQGLADLLEDHQWLLVDAIDPQNQRIDALFPDPDRSFVFNFAGSRLHVQGGCNGFRGEFGLGDDNELSVTGRMSTLMACDPPLMAADAALSALMAEPLETVLVRGAQPTLALVTNTNTVLLLTGELTPEARYGAPTMVFLEVAAQAVECEGSVRSDGMCLQVRDRSFDEQGLLVDTPSEWRAFGAEIEGYQHEPGIRNVLRVKRFQPDAGAGMPAGAIYVLDMVVQSEVVSE